MRSCAPASNTWSRRASSLNLLFVIDPPEELKAYKDTTVSMMRAAQARRHAVFVCEQTALRWAKNTVAARATHLSIASDDRNWYRAQESVERPLHEFGAVLMRKDPPFDMEYVASTWLLSEAERQGAKVFNAPDALRDHNEKLAVAEFAQFIVPSLVSRRMDDLQGFVDEHRHVVLKRLDGMGGAGIFVLRHDDPNRNVIVETISDFGTRSVMAQRYIPEIAQGDKRVLLIDGKIVPHCLARIPKPGESRGNLAAGGRGVAQPVSERHREIAAALGPRLAARGLLLVGLDVIGDWLTEINVTSPTCFREIQDQSGFDVAGMFLEALESKLS
jgi:glutathione synthase